MSKSETATRTRGRGKAKGKGPPENAEPDTRRRYKKGRRVAEFCRDTGVSRPTCYRWARIGILMIERAGCTPFVVGGPACLDIPAA
jgi:hypothetical protein